ncbi:MAG TPA: PHP domain-containing protein [Candidatus Methylomirabilis sp.]|nr:PHP domain-containing protein [Candidatus Methylomirabilis sp.]
MRIDLHMHSTVSDGLLDPVALVGAVLESGLQVFSLTDHDSVDGSAEVETHALVAGLRFIPGIEVSAFWKRVEFHFLGYFLEPKDEPLLTFLRSTREARRKRLQAMVSRLWALGIAVDVGEVMALARDGNVGRPHLARVLVRHGVVANTDEAFDRYLGVDKAAYVPRPDVTVQDAIRVIHDAGGLASLAHPGLTNRDDAIPDLVGAGLDALEIYHPKHSPGLVRHYRKTAERLGLLVTGGSDFHGQMGQYPGLGIPCLPESDFLRLETAAVTRRATARAS